MTMHLHIRSPPPHTVSHVRTHAHKQLFTFGRIHIYIGPLTLRMIEHVSVNIQPKYDVMIRQFSPTIKVNTVAKIKRYLTLI